ncbi:ankyrin repeat family protein [Artemisia annua]|uniref:Ankyrin repeat family protein n=1 Tax=Artemisia annua TaxID=35608 RepID=A0A2U1Q3P2_ARTAN|nr:ankyrin repeat family protein [Artemisia annua]
MDSSSSTAGFTRIDDPYEPPLSCEIKIEQKFGICPTPCDMAGQNASPIDWAAANVHYDLVREVLSLDSNHLIKLSFLNCIRRLELVWDDGEQFEDVAKKMFFRWLLYTAASASDFPFVQELLHKDALPVFYEGEYGVTDALYAASRGIKVLSLRV